MIIFEVCPMEDPLLLGHLSISTALEVVSWLHPHHRFIDGDYAQLRRGNNEYPDLLAMHIRAIAVDIEDRIWMHLTPAARVTLGIYDRSVAYEPRRWQPGINKSACRAANMAALSRIISMVPRPSAAPQQAPADEHTLINEAAFEQLRTVPRYRDIGMTSGVARVAQAFSQFHNREYILVARPKATA